MLLSLSSSAGMTKVKVGKEDQSSNEFVEKRRSALERYDVEKIINTPKYSWFSAVRVWKI